MDRLAAHLAASRRLLVLTGAGCSTASGITDYRDENGAWKRPRRPIQHAEFVGSATTRQRYWARSAVGWPRFRAASPSAAHDALAALGARGGLTRLVTQNVDRLHQRAGSREVVDLHGRLDHVVCLGCGQLERRDTWQTALLAGNPAFAARATAFAPDGDADLDDEDTSGFVVPACVRCGGVMKPDVVFYGGNVPADRVAAVHADVDASDALLVVGSSLMVFSGFRFVRRAVAANKPVLIVNRGRTRADDVATLKVEGDCGDILAEVVRRLATP
ncbi:MAG: NAD-dependent protein deacetylase [Planctomycetota bacterium]